MFAALQLIVILIWIYKENVRTTIFLLLVICFVILVVK